MLSASATTAALLLALSGPRPQTEVGVHADGPGGQDEPAKTRAVDHRGIYFGSRISLGAAVVSPTHARTTGRVDAMIGYGVTEDSLIGVDFFVATQRPRACGPAAYGGDVRGTGYAWRGLYFRAGMGLAAVPGCPDVENADDGSNDIGFGGQVGTGYEVALGRRTTIGIDVGYDARFVPDSRFPRHAGLAGLRFVWF